VKTLKYIYVCNQTTEKTEPRIFFIHFNFIEGTHIQASNKTNYRNLACLQERDQTRIYLFL